MYTCTLRLPILIRQNISQEVSVTVTLLLRKLQLQLQFSITKAETPQAKYRKLKPLEAILEMVFQNVLAHSRAALRGNKPISREGPPLTRALAQEFYGNTSPVVISLTGEAAVTGHLEVFRIGDLPPTGRTCRGLAPHKVAVTSEASQT